jgi:DNA-binding transcriptional LysR family regulator
MFTPPSLRKLQYILAVAREQHFRKAAEKLHVSQPAVSRQIRQCEDEFGFEILHRDHHFVALTKAGKSFVTDIDDILQRLDSDFSKAIIRALAINGQSGSEYVIAQSPYAPSQIRRAVLRLQRSIFGRVQLRLRILSTVEMLTALECGVIQAGITFGPIEDASVVSIPIGVDHWVAVIPASTRFAEMRTVSLEALREFPIISNGAERTHPALSRYLQKQCAARGFRFRPFAEVSSPHEAFDLVQTNHGMIFLPESVCDGLPAGIRAVRVTDLPDLETVLIHRSGHAEFIPALAERLRGFLHKGEARLHGSKSASCIGKKKK